MYIFNEKLVLVCVLQTLTFLTLISADNSSSLPPSTLTTTNTTKHTEKSNGTVQESTAASKSPTIFIEGGGKIKSLPQPTSVNISQAHNREHVINLPIIINQPAVIASSVSPISTPSSASPKIQPSVNSSTNSSSSTTTERSTPKYEDKSVVSNKSESSEHRKIAARKGVVFNITDTEKVKPKKPTVTVAADEPYAPSHFQSKSNSSKSQNIPKVPNLTMLSESDQGKTQKYVVPIVIVILSVPFVAILISILYKRGSEWWKYRHYRRMDFLINGMYDN